MTWCKKDAQIQYTKNRPTGPIFYIAEDDFGNPLDAHGPHKEGDIIYLVGTSMFGVVISDSINWNGWFKIQWEDSIISAAFSENTVLRNMIKVENDSPNERLKLIIKYGNY